MKKKKNKQKIAILVGGLVVLAAASITIALIAGRRVNEKKYGAKMESAQQYLLEEDYDTAETMYLQSIQMYPEKTEAYKELISLYIKEEEYDQAYETADQGYAHTKDTFFESVMEKVRAAREQKAKTTPVEIEQEVFFERDTDNIAVRFNLLDNVAAFCYQQYVNTYGSSTVKEAGELGYEVKFANFSGSVYFKNTSDMPNAVDKASRKVEKKAKPYRIELSSPAMLFVGYENYASYDKLLSVFNIQQKVQKDQEGNYWLNFEKNGCLVKMKTDKNGDLSGKTPVMILEPLDLKTVTWEEEPEEEPEEEEETFVLAGNTYTYDVTEISIRNQQIDDLSPLEKCKKLRSLILIDCGIEDISPLSGCESLKELFLDMNSFSDLSPLAGLKNLEYLQFHESGVSDLSPIYDLDLKLLNPCSDGVTLDQVEEYKERHPDCTCYWDYYLVE